MKCLSCAGRPWAGAWPTVGQSPLGGVYGLARTPGSWRAACVWAAAGTGWGSQVVWGQDSSWEEEVLQPGSHKEPGRGSRGCTFRKETFVLTQDQVIVLVDRVIQHRPGPAEGQPPSPAPAPWGARIPSFSWAEPGEVSRGSSPPCLDVHLDQELCHPRPMTVSGSARHCSEYITTEIVS